MKFLVNKSTFSEAISKVSRAVAQKASEPALEGILLSAEGSMLTLAAYNYDIGMKKEIEVNCTEAGDIIIGAKILLDIVRKMPGDEIEFICDNSMVCHIISESSTFDIVGIDPATFPELPSAAGGKILNIPGNIIKSMVKGTIFAVEEENPMPMYTGIYFEVEKDYIQLVALDGLRIAIRKETAKNEDTMNFVATGKCISEMFKLIEDESENIEIFVGDNHISFNIGGYYLVSRLIEGTYLDYKSIIKDEEKTKITVNTNEIIGAIDRISLIISNPRNTPVRCSVKDEEMFFTCATTLGRSKDSCPIEKNGADIEFGFNAKFLLDAMRATETDEVIMIFNGEIAPIMIKPTAGDDFLYIVMPMRIRNG